MKEAQDKKILFSLPIKRVPDIKEEDRINLAGKVAFITGGSRGIGKATCERLVQAGCKVIGTARNPSNYKKPEHYELRQLDVRSDDSVKKCVDGIISDYGQIDILVNNAGIGQYGRLIKSTPQDWINLFETNLFGQHRVAVACYDHMIRTDTRIISIGSLEGSIPIPYMSIYGISKRALGWWSVLLALEQQQVKNGPSFSVLEPSYVASTFADKTQTDNYVHTEPDSDDKQVKLNALFFPLAIKRGMSPDSVAEAIYYIACSKEPRQQYFIDKKNEMVIGIGKSIEDLLTLMYTQPIENTMQEISKAMSYVISMYGKFGGILSFLFKPR